VAAFASAAEGAPIVGELREQFVEPFIVAVSQSFRDWPGTEVMVRSVCQQIPPRLLGDMSAEVALRGPRDITLALSFPQATATGLGDSALAGTAYDMDDSLLYDCLGELANVVAGQAKALLAGTPYHFTFGTPKVVYVDPRRGPEPGQDCLVVVFGSQWGDFALQLIRS
jgi:CheY-specific phosphatase CheX